MNFLKALAEMRKGKKVRSKTQMLEIDYLFLSDMDNISIKKGNIKPGVVPHNILLDYFNATDWEVVDSDTYWNLAEKENISKNYGNWNVEHFFWKDDVKKCRDLIIKELDEDLANDSGVQQSQRRIWHNWFKKIVNERFGDL